MKILKYFSILAAAAGIMSACTSDLEKVQTLPADQVVAPVLHELETSEVVITAETLVNTFNIEWDAAYFGDQIVPSYSVLISNADVEVAVAVGIAANEIALTYEQINSAASSSKEDGGLGLPVGVASDVKLRIGATVGSSYDTYYSEAKDIKITTTSAEKKYPMIYMPGSYQSWNPADAATKFQVLYDFAGNGVFEGIADFGKSEDASREWKFTKEPNWDFDWGIPAGETPEAEAAEVTLINNDGGDRSNINIYTAKRFYHFTMDTNTGLLKHNYSFNQVGVVGAFTDWAAGQDKVMEFNAAKRRFWVDVENLSGEFKFRADGAWTLNWGGGAFGIEGDNLVCETAGNYRVYLYLSNSAEMRYELNADMFGQEEPAGDNAGGTTPEPEPTPAIEWGLMGDFQDNSWSSDIELKAAGAWRVAEDVVFANANGEGLVFKVRQNQNWSTSYGVAGSDAFAVGTEIALDGGNNIAINGEVGVKYDVYFDANDMKIWVMADGQTPSVTPDSIKLYVDVTATGWTECSLWAWDSNANYTGGSWPGEALVLEGDKYVWTVPADVVGKTINVIFNNAGKGQQTADITGVVMDKDHTFVVNADLSYTMDGAQPEPEPEPTEKEYGLIGVGNDWSNDIKFEAMPEGGYKLVNQTILASDGFKVRLVGKWVDTDNYGAPANSPALVINEAFALECGGGSGNMSVPADGTYDLYFYPADLTLYVMEAGKTPEK